MPSRSAERFFPSRAIAVTTIAVACAAALGGCATYQLDLTPRDRGAVAHGVAHQSDKSVEVTLDGRQFAGHYTFVQGGAIGTVTTGGAPAMGIAAAGAGNGMFIASDAAGDHLRCQFEFSSWSQSGFGVCQLDEAVYDLQITR